MYQEGGTRKPEWSCQIDTGNNSRGDKPIYINSKTQEKYPIFINKKGNLS